MTPEEYNRPVHRVVAMVLSMALACGGRSPVGVGDGGSVLPDTVGISEPVAGLGPVRKLDVLVVMDDSAGVNEGGIEEVPRALMTLFNALRQGPHGLPDIHLGVVSQDLGAGATEVGGCRPGGKRGALVPAERCGIAAGERFLTIADGGARINSSRSLEETLRCLTNVPIDGCGYEHFLAAAVRALSGAVPDNAGFARPDADLALFIHADEDDCSAPPDSGFFTIPMAAQSASFRCALAGHRCDGRRIPTAEFEAPFAACSDDPTGGGYLIPVEQAIAAARALRPGRRLFVGGAIGKPIPGDAGIYHVSFRTGQAWLDSVCGLTAFPGLAGSAAPAPRLARFFAALGGTTASLCHAPSYHTVAQSLAAKITAAN